MTSGAPGPGDLSDDMGNSGNTECWDFGQLPPCFPAEGDVYRAQTPTKDSQGVLQVKEDVDVLVEVPVDQVGSEGWPCLPPPPSSCSINPTHTRLILTAPHLVLAHRVSCGPLLAAHSVLAH